MRSFWIVAVLVLGWNLFGDAAYVVQATRDLGAMGGISAEPLPAMPRWAWYAYAVAVWIATGGAIALILRQKVATVLFAVSLVAVVVHFSWSFFVFGIVGARGWSQAVFPGVIIAITAFQMVYAHRRTADGTLR
ncbi:hypothetical protein WSK_3953 [Novosphingobium sp. Rr 2-17]|uniref:hypothetical protein n=1 Tax=Novosphingobium sp. Rr 2-17 TaxID=555793 RepID=UPI000269957A|nr:hypothetical protein [Novosphingobium sp. Rr 2-17]EIZ77571.1 hypothetical protein WSK_3953 [Novosphingobium sp. Rr 2-17]